MSSIIYHNCSASKHHFIYCFNRYSVFHPSTISPPGSIRFHLRWNAKLFEHTAGWKIWWSATQIYRQDTRRIKVVSHVQLPKSGSGEHETLVRRDLEVGQNKSCGGDGAPKWLMKRQWRYLTVRVRSTCDGSCKYVLSYWNFAKIASWLLFGVCVCVVSVKGS